ncbi:major facilitator superfamily MFS_1 [Fibrella aestuarina BUZ 2]|uniref:Major facilitator superfamily MFS_1 n=2 Tax=Fibrella TaxID=861914 RepID=I0K333_9BACT|nr:major facilitator superfamily MFS_1 [Fibrella aestuarina BUZ 2]
MAGFFVYTLMFKNPKLALVYGITFIDAVVAGGVGPLFNKYTETLSAKQVWVMAGSALLLGLQLVLSPVLGALSDKIGRRPVLIGTALGSLLAPFLLLPVNVGGYLSNRAVEGTTNGMSSVLRSAVVDMAPKQDMMQQTSIQGSITALGALFGPAVGGVLIIALAQARFDPIPIVIMCIGLAVLNVVLTFIFKETNQKEKQPVELKELKAKALNAIKVKTLWDQLAEVDKKLEGFKDLYILQLLSLLALGYYNYFIAYLIVGDLGLTPKQASFFFIYYSLITFATNLLFFQFAVKHVNQRKMLIVLAFVGIGVMGLYAFTGGSVMMLYIAATVDSLSIGLLAGLISGLTSQLVSKGEGQGSIFGDTQALGGVASFMAAVATTLLTAVDARAPFIFYALALGVIAYRAIYLPEASAKETEPANQNYV